MDKTIKYGEQVPASPVVSVPHWPSSKCIYCVIAQTVQWPVGVKQVKEPRAGIEKSAVRDAVNWFRRERLTGCLLLGDAGRYEPGEVLVGPRALKAGANALNRRAEACGRWEGDEAEMKKISKEWDALWDAAIPPEKPKKTLKRRIS